MAEPTDGFLRIPGLFRAAELETVLRCECEYHIANCDECPPDAVPLFVVYERYLGGSPPAFDASKAREELLREIDQVLQASSHWIGGRLDTIVKLVQMANSYSRSKLDCMRTALETIERSGVPGGTIVARRADNHACGWCCGMLTPCPVETARLALQESQTRAGTGTPGQRDPDFPCAEFKPGEPSYGRCDGDGHYLCEECVELCAVPVQHPCCPHCGRETGNEELPDGRVVARECCVADLERARAIRCGEREEKK